MQKAIIKKDIGAVVSNKNMMVALIVVPLVFTVVLPLIFIIAIYSTPDDLGDLEQMLALLPSVLESDNISFTFVGLFLNYVFPILFTLIPVMASTIMAASSFVGEKEKRTLETLLYSPLTLTQIFQSKVWASFLLSMSVTFASFAIMMIVVEAAVFLLFGSLVLPGISWLITLLVVSPAVSLLAIIFIVSGSAKAKTMEESQQRAIFLVLPLLLLVVSQFSGLVLISAWYLLAFGLIIAVVAFIMMKKSMSRFTYELLLSK